MASRINRKLVRGRLLLALVTVSGLGLLAIPPAASSEGEIVIHGPASSSHLRLTVNGGAIIVNGYLDRSRQVGCTDSQHALLCPLAGVGRIEIDMGPEDDKVDVLDPLPIPLTVHLGNGSDKFNGNSEEDTCYPEGSIANGCSGGGGNDICITGQLNTECYGGPGNDFSKAGPGSDGSWGGPGDDVCYMGAGEDACHGGSGNDRLYGGPDADQLYGGPGSDYCDGGPGVGRSHGCETGPGH